MDRRSSSPACATRPSRTGSCAVLDAPANPENTGSLRTEVSKTLADWGLERLADRVRLAASELLTNALLHGSTATLTLCLEIDGTWLRVSVPDANPDVPHLGHALEDDENGRGITLIAAFSDAWGFRSTATGKCVFAEFRTDSDAP